MKNFFVFLIGICTLISITNSTVANTTKTVEETVWTPTFFAIQPRTDIKNPVSKAFCLTHTPNTLRTTISQIKKGVRAENGVYIKYLSYTTTHKHGLGFNVVNARVWTTDKNGKITWESPMWEYQQNLSDTGVTNTVWATNVCKGKFIGVSNQS
ncbi:hypothetical protein [Facilibium subflavum]|uniref:hypothetical protein n=1 Tax=Facilibium subflavum TaxID=2219058 RepID=UPI000E659899|nr:hypothetical protein [Facilibium subflavum]